MAARPVLASELAKMRLDNQWAGLSMAILDPAIIYTARVDGAPASTDRLTEITYDGGTPVGGDLADCLFGMMLWVGSGPGLYDRGQARIRAAPDGTKFYIGETSEIDVQDDDYLTVVDDVALWPRQVYVSGGVSYMDYNIGYSDQHTNCAPLPVMGPHRVYRLKPGEVVTFAFDWSASWVPSGAITYVCTAPGSSASTGLNTATPTVSYDTPGTYRIACAATANGATTIGYRYIFIFDKVYPPITQFTPGSIQSGDDGYSFDVTMYAEAGTTTVRDRALCILFAEDYYGNIKGSMGPVAGAENIIAYGWIVGETIQVNPEQSIVKFDVKGPGYWLGQITAFPQGLENVNALPAAWTQMGGLTVDKSLWHLFLWRSTAALCCDITLTGDTKLAFDLTAAASTLWEQIGMLANQQLLAKPLCDRYGHIYVEVDAQYIPVADRAASIVTVMALTKNDWLDSLDIDRAPTPSVSLLDFSGIYYDGYTTISYFSLANGHIFKEHGKMERMDRLLLSSQSQSNELAGLILGKMNNTYPRITARLAGNNRFLDVAPRQYVTLSIDAADSPRGVAITSLDCIPRRISYKWDSTSGAFLPEVEFEGATLPELAITGDAPGVQPLPPPSSVPSQSIITAPIVGDGNLLYVATTSKIGRTRNALDASPNWVDVTGSITGTIGFFCVDDYSQRNIGYVGTTEGLWVTNNLNDTLPGWQCKFTAAQFLSATGKTISRITNVKSSPARQGAIYAQVVTPDYLIYAGRSLNSGQTWVWRQVSPTPNGVWATVISFNVSPHDANKVWSSGMNGELWYSANATGAFTFSRIYVLTMQVPLTPLFNIVLPWLGNAADQIIYISGTCVPPD